MPVVLGPVRRWDDATLVSHSTSTSGVLRQSPWSLIPFYSHAKPWISGALEEFQHALPMQIQSALSLSLSLLAVLPISTFHQIATTQGSDQQLVKH